MGRALKNYGILAKEETEGLAEDDTTADEGDWVSDPGKGKDDEDDGWGQVEALCLFTFLEEK